VEQARRRATPQLVDFYPQVEEKHVRLRIRAVQRGDPAPRRKCRYRLLEERIQHLRDEYCTGARSVDSRSTGRPSRTVFITSEHENVIPYHWEPAGNLTTKMNKMITLKCIRTVGPVIKTYVVYVNLHISHFSTGHVDLQGQADRAWRLFQGRMFCCIFNSLNRNTDITMQITNILSALFYKLFNFTYSHHIYFANTKSLKRNYMPGYQKSNGSFTWPPVNRNSFYSFISDHTDA